MVWCDTLSTEVSCNERIESHFPTSCKCDMPFVLVHAQAWLRDGRQGFASTCRHRMGVLLCGYCIGVLLCGYCIGACCYVVSAWVCCCVVSAWVCCYVFSFEKASAQM